MTASGSTTGLLSAAVAPGGGATTDRRGRWQAAVAAQRFATANIAFNTIATYAGGGDGGQLCWGYKGLLRLESLASFPNNITTTTVTE